jgi:hypothetical protein
LLPAAVANGMLAPRIIDQNAPHGLSGSGKEMGAAFPLHILILDQPQPGLMDQRCGLQGLAGRFVGHFLRGKASQLLVNEREQLVGGLAVAVLNGVQNARDFAHREYQVSGFKLALGVTCNLKLETSFRSQLPFVRLERDPNPF